MKPAQKARDRLVKNLRNRATAMDRGTYTMSPVDLRQAANEIEDLGLTAEAAHDVWEVATRKGMLFSTDPKTGSDKLVGFFVPAHLMNDLGSTIIKRTM